MCGIAGIFRSSGAISHDDGAAVQRMVELQRHRGPDDQGFFSDSHAALAHARLSILDLSSAGRQPMADARGAVQIVFNGEIYNFKILRQELSDVGYAFRTQTDTEVLLNGYLCWGFESLLQRLRGMFAFALYDPSSMQGPQLFLARDRFGIKPLYYHQTASGLFFSSEFRALTESGLVPREPNNQALARFLQLGSVPGPDTMIKNILLLPPGHMLLVRGGVASLKSYWSVTTAFLSPPRRQPSFRQAIAGVRQRLEESVRIHLISDVPTGVFLSGGVDSSALVALAGRRSGPALKTLSVVFDEAAYNEAAFADVVAKHYHTDHQEILIKETDFFQNLPAFFQAMDQPTVDGVNSYSVSRAARQAGLKVVLSGLGGDEVFLGYSHFAKARWAGRIRSILGMFPYGLQKRILNASIGLAREMGKGSYQKLSYLAGSGPEEAYLLFRGLFNPAQIRDLLGLTEIELRSLCPIPRFGDIPSALGSAESVDLLEFMHYLPNQLLRDTDVMSMAHSIEVRVPFLDHPLVEYVAGLPLAYKMRSGIPKQLLIRALGNDFPKAVWNRPKQGFSFPMREWLLKRSHELEEQSCENSWMDAKAVHIIWDEFRASRLHWSRAWATLVLSQFERNPQGRRLQPIVMHGGR